MRRVIFPRIIRNISSKLSIPKLVCARIRACGHVSCICCYASVLVSCKIIGWNLYFHSFNMICSCRERGKILRINSYAGISCIRKRKFIISYCKHRCKIWLLTHIMVIIIWFFIYSYAGYSYSPICKRFEIIYCKNPIYRKFCFGFSRNSSCISTIM